MKSFLHSAFVRYGAGPDLLTPISRLKYFNVIAWTTIGVGTAAWVVALFVVRF